MWEDIGMKKERRKRKIIGNRIRWAAHVHKWKLPRKPWQAKDEGKGRRGGWSMRWENSLTRQR